MGQYKIIISLLKKLYIFQFILVLMPYMNNVIFFLKVTPEKLTFSSLQKRNDHYLMLLSMVKLRLFNYSIYVNETIL